MAGEYSRELSVKVHAGLSRITAMGFHSGAEAGYGLRRVLLDDRGNRKMELAPGQRKSITTDRVILVPGPANELATIRHVYDQFIDQKKTMIAIAEYLNRQGVLNVNGGRWTNMAIRALLTNEKYIGNAVFNRGSKKLGEKWKPNPADEWVRAVGAFEAIVTKRLILTKPDCKFKKTGGAIRTTICLRCYVRYWIKEISVSSRASRNETRGVTSCI